jgi:hypothetical protein
MLTNQELDALMLKIVINNTLVVSSDPDTPLLQFSKDALSTLFSHSRDVALCSSVLKGEAVTIPHKDISNGVKYWT